jgi:hypothetical protein
MMINKCFENVYMFREKNKLEKKKKRLFIYLRHCMYVEKRDACPERKKERKKKKDITLNWEMQSFDSGAEEEEEASSNAKMYGTDDDK